MLHHALRRSPSAMLAAKRMYSVNDPKHSPNRAPKQPKIITAVTVLAFTVTGAYLLFGDSSAEAREATSVKPHRIPSISENVSEDDITVPVKVLSLKAAEEKLREGARTFVFDGKDGLEGRIDLVRLSSNCPVEDEWSLGVGKGVGGSRTVFAGVYDGHAGWATSAVLKETLIPSVSASLSKLSQSAPGDEIDKTIKNAFSQLDDHIMGTAKNAVQAHGPASAEAIATIAMATAGSCALLSIYDPRTSIVRTAVTGDSRAVLGSWSSESKSFIPEALSKDQTGFNEAEVERLSNDHPGEKDDIIDPKTGRLLGMAVTRAFGDHRWKWPLDFIEHCQRTLFSFPPRPNYKTPPYMTATPEVTTRVVSTEDFIILASDGLWDRISNDDAVTCISRWLAARRTNTTETADAETVLTNSIEDGLWWRAKPEDYVIEDLDSAAICLVRNAFGGRKRELFRGFLTAREPSSRYLRDDITVQVIFFKDPY